jgi:nucleoid-associated protein YgaU
MTDDANDKQPQPRRRRRAPEDAASAAGGRERGASPPAAADDDPMAALERLQSLTSATAASPVSDVPPATDAPPAGAPRPASLARRPSRLRPAAAPRPDRMVARIVAPIVFLVAVVILLSIVLQSGVIGGKTEPVVTPTPATTKTKGGGTSSNYKLYTVKSGDTLSAIAVKFDTTTSEIEALNPKISGSTLVVGTKIKVPKPAP